ncbi:hypothetical protein BKA69DRAFT_1071721 [Paraphysoderma sedebokerense]|nr:hypothetical protein BKA69DRAFT_1071721 [Paraphysoderma sedebokerense]
MLTFPTHPLKNLRQDNNEMVDKQQKLKAILSKDYTPDENEKDTDDMSVEEEEPVPLTSTYVQGYCVECEDMPATMFCEQCQEDFCEVCWKAQHRKGRNRSKHTTKPLVVDPLLTSSNSTSVPIQPSQTQLSGEDPTSATSTNLDLPITPVITSPSSASTFGAWITERSKFIPVRLTLEERKWLRLLDAALKVTEYTDKIDIISYTSKTKRIVAQIRELCSILSGLVLAADYKRGQELFEERDFKENEEFFSAIFEIGRRYKVLNPEKMRHTYGKLIYMLQDSAIEEVQDMLQFSCISELKTVYSTLESKNALDLLQDEYVAVATREILADGKSKRQIQQEIRAKEKAVELLARKYSSPAISQEEIRQCLYSIGDNHNYLRFNRDPCDKMIKYLTLFFAPDKVESGFSLAIQSGREGARLSHNHERQYTYVYQSLCLWREIAHEMFQLWILAEGDLLSTNSYRLRDTGQGLNRCPRVSRAMHTILSRAQQKVGYWVGSSVIHLGDENVPNVSRILNPIIRCLEEADVLYENEHMQTFVDNMFGGLERCKKSILSDFFRHAFDGSGADNFNSAGSCIDGRLTSAWNWCSQIEKKPYFPIFLLSGFIGFDGESFEV